MNWQGKKVLVTGACGFIGSHLTEKLVSLGCSVRALVYYNSFNRWGWLDTLAPVTLDNIEVVAGDIRDPHQMLEITRDREVIFHLAALIAIPYSYHAPSSYVATNVAGTCNVLQGARQAGNLEKLVHTSTSEVYGTALRVPIDENHPLQGQSPYSASKIGADMMAESFYRSFKLPVAICRPFNTYGPRQSARAVIPTVITQLQAGAEQLKLGSLHPTRDFNYVSDTVAGFLAVAASPEAAGEVINIGTGKEISIGDLVKKIMAITGRDAAIETEDARVRPAGSEVERLLADNRKAKQLLGWEPRVDIGTGLQQTAAWLQENRKDYKAGIYNL